MPDLKMEMRLLDTRHFDSSTRGVGDLIFSEAICVVEYERAASSTPLHSNHLTNSCKRKSAEQDQESQLKACAGGSARHHQERIILAAVTLSLRSESRRKSIRG